jgi:hypothetical protein
MSPERYQLLIFFRELIQLSINYPGRSGWGHACSELLSDLILAQNHFIDRIVGDYSGEFNEYRLNGAGLKMHWKVKRDKIVISNSQVTERAHFQCYISGDQKKDYDDFVVMAEKYIKKRGCNHR